MNEKIEVKETAVKRIGGYLHRVIPIADKSGEILSYALKPIMVEFKPRDIFQVIVGSSLLAIPVAFSEEAWTLGSILSVSRVAMLSMVSLLFIGAFVFFNFYKGNFRKHIASFFKRVLGTYFISLIIVAIVLTIIQKCPWYSDYVLALKRIIIVAFPASMSGTLSDTIK